MSDILKGLKKLERFFGKKDNPIFAVDTMKFLTEEEFNHIFVEREVELERRRVADLEIANLQRRSTEELERLMEEQRSVRYSRIKKLAKKN